MRDQRDKHRKIYGKHGHWEVFKHNLGKLLCVDILSKAFIVLVGSMTFTVWFLHHQLYVTKQMPTWMELGVAIVIPSFFAYLWIEKSKASAILISLSEGIKAWFNKK
jgi:hypothetical protein